MYDNFDIVSIIRQDLWCYPFRMNKGTETKGPSPILPDFVQDSFVSGNQPLPDKGKARTGERDVVK